LLIEAAAKLPEHRTSLIALSVDANFPPQAGLGWSAAFSVALARAVRAYQGRAPNDDLAAQAGLVYERHFHGCPSGIDSTTIAFEAPCYVKTGRAFVNGTRTRARGPLAGFIDIAPGGVFVVADSGERGSTRQAIEQTARLLDRRHKQRVVGKLTDVAETIALQMATALSRGDFPYVGLMLNESHLLLKALELSTPRLDHLRHVALSAGALGAKLTGSGLGGCLLALCLPDRVQEVAAALRAAGVSTLFTQPTAALMSAKKDAA
jgi:mevalonate kinase